MLGVRRSWLGVGRAVDMLAMTMPVRAPTGQPISVLEGGAGTGAVTRALMAQCSAGSRLDVIEANPRFATRLNRIADAQPIGNADIRIHRTRIECHDADAYYDVVVSYVPFANVAPQQVDVIIRRYFAMLRPSGVLVYFSHFGMRWARGLVASRDASSPCSRPTPCQTSASIRDPQPSSVAEHTARRGEAASALSTASC